MIEHTIHIIYQPSLSIPYLLVLSCFVLLAFAGFGDVIVILLERRISTQSMQLPDYPNAKELYISPEGLQKLMLTPKDPEYPARNVLWTTEMTTELPIRLGTEGLAAQQPTTLLEQFREKCQTFAQRPALSTKVKGVWMTINYQKYYQESVRFAKALLSFELSEHSVINIIGFNAPEWFMAFYGSLMARCIPVGIYTTSSLETCEYIARHSQAKIILAENREYAKKYLSLLDKGQIRLIVIYRDDQYQPLEYEGRIISYKRFIAQGARIEDKVVEDRTAKVKPGHCCTLVYTSGTTGMPKGVMLSHDNYTWTKKSLDAFRERDTSIMHRSVSYLPLSHVASQFSDIVGSMTEGVHVFFAEPTALQGTLIQTLQEVRPTFFFSVPRVWEKIYDKMMEIARSNGWLKTKIATWAKQIGAEGTQKMVKKLQPSIGFKLANLLVYKNVKKALGLDECLYFFYGAAPLDPTIRRYFLSLNFFLINSYGMSESTGPQNMTHEDTLDFHGPLEGFREVGRSLPGTQITIAKVDQADQDGQIYYRGRNTFMGYYKNPEETAKTIDSNGYLHSGDNGKLTKEGVLFITGRAKELIITAGGENIPPLLIENEIRAVIPFIANVMVIGEGRKYLACLLTLKEDAPGSGKLDLSAINYLTDRGCEAKTVVEAMKDEKIKKILNQGLKVANKKAISRAQNVQGFIILPEDFSVDNGTLTPTLKLKRKEVTKKYAAQIDQLYIKPSL